MFFILMFPLGPVIENDNRVICEVTILLLPFIDDLGTSVSP